MSPYQLDYDWLREVMLAGDVAVVRLTVDSPVASEAVIGLERRLPADEHGVLGRGGWAVYTVEDGCDGAPCVLDILAGGEDMADALEDATAELAQHFADWGIEDLRWENFSVQAI